MNNVKTTIKSNKIESRYFRGHFYKKDDDGSVYIVAQIDDNEFYLINLATGTRWTHSTDDISSQIEKDRFTALKTGEEVTIVSQ